MRKLTYLLAALLSFLPAVFHYRLTSVPLWNHGSSAALELCIAMWVIAVAIAFYACLLAYIEFGMKP